MEASLDDGLASLASLSNGHRTGLAIALRAALGGGRSEQEYDLDESGSPEVPGLALIKDTEFTLPQTRQLSEALLVPLVHPMYHSGRWRA
ncbi:unnamed protein product, partial [Chrysoparadoxa australica]